ncbi:glycosyltransferase family 4 protein [Pollutimonas sp. H1-120]|uniref:MraY family glycosyltransferase n=1 Tax=Pollutimonas sp. H1-120 TaxID=3148824 RepID=UPI003B523901
MKNDMLLWGALLLAVLLAAWLLTAVLRRYALAHQVIDIPNKRSSHTMPTPRGGGVAIVACFLLSLPVLAMMGWIGWSMAYCIGGAGLVVALLGFLDDHGHIAARWRLLGHFAAAAWVLFWMGGLPAFSVFGHMWDMGWFGYVLGALYLVWVLNLYNFMDGIDGLASVEAIFVAIGGASFYIIAGDTSLAGAPVALACAVAGFLYWNFPPAKIFMGDAGSGFLGVVLGALSLQAAWVEPQLFWSWLILLGVFIVDASLTLFRRLLRGERVYEAHRSHAYQWAARRFGKHLPVTLSVIGLNLCWLYPVAWFVAVGKLDGVIGVVIAYVPLAFLAFKLQGGQAEAAAV